MSIPRIVDDLKKSVDRLIIEEYETSAAIGKINESIDALCSDCIKLENKITELANKVDNLVDIVQRTLSNKGSFRWDSIRQKSQGNENNNGWN